jgi:hypothetical protein
MKFTPIKPPRTFEVTGAGVKLMLSDCGRIELAADEQVTFTTPDGGEYDVTRKDWGFYATPSINGRLKSFGLRTALVTNVYGRLYLTLVEKGKEDIFNAYVESDHQKLLCWLDDDAEVKKLTGFYRVHI